MALKEPIYGKPVVEDDYHTDKVDEAFFRELKERGMIRDYLMCEDTDVVMVRIKYPIKRIDLELDDDKQT